MMPLSLISAFYYVIAGLAIIAAFIRLVYGWFRDYDNAQRFATDMASVHLPYIYSCMNRIANRLDIELDASPTVNFVNPKSRHNPS